MAARLIAFSKALPCRLSFLRRTSGRYSATKLSRLLCTVAESRMVYERSLCLPCALLHIRRTSQKARQTAVSAVSYEVEDMVDVVYEGAGTEFSSTNQATAEIEADARHLLRQLRQRETAETGPYELSIVLCDDTYIAELNLEHRKKAGPTDVLSFETESPPGYPMHLLGDLVMSLDTARRQAEEEGHSLRDELRVLLVHGILHLTGLDHERGDSEAEKMAAEERQVLASLGWQGSGLVSASLSTDVHIGDNIGDKVTSSPSTSSLDSENSTVNLAETNFRRATFSKIKLLALDMDGTLLDSHSQVLPSSVDALKAALVAGVTVCLATGKARPAAERAMMHVGLAGEGKVISNSGPGLFLQGLAVHGKDGRLLEGPDLPRSTVELAFRYSQELDIPLAAFLGDECVTLKMHPELEELHYRYYEPLCGVSSSLNALLEGPPVKKLLFMTHADTIASTIQPHWTEALQNSDAETTIAVPNMLEIVPAGINKWIGMQLLLQDLGLNSSQLMSCGDGSNDLALVANSGLGIAMGNAVPQVKQAAKVVVASNDDNGIAEAIEKFIL